VYLFLDRTFGSVDEIARPRAFRPVTGATVAVVKALLLVAIIIATRHGSMARAARLALRIICLLARTCMWSSRSRLVQPELRTGLVDSALGRRTRTRVVNRTARKKLTAPLYSSSIRHTQQDSLLYTQILMHSSILYIILYPLYPLWDSLVTLSKYIHV
jgi:hypothetical protein